VVLTTCPSCVAGLSKLRSGKPVTGKPLILEIAERALGPQWQEDFLAAVKREGLERIPM
jgi:hypothetical protein